MTTATEPQGTPAPTPETGTTGTVDPHAFLRAQSRWSVFEVIFWLAALTPFVLFPTYLNLASQIAITALFALSLDLILGYAGIISLGHAVFFGIGAYAAGILSAYGWGEPISGLLVAALAAAIVGYVTSFLIVRVQHLALLMITVGLGFIAVEIANSAAWLTGGADGLLGVDTWPIFGVWNFDFYFQTAYAYSLAVLFVLFVVSRRLVHSPFGLSLRGIRENSVRMPAVGAPSKRRLQKVYIISAAIAGVAGGLLTQTTEFASLESLGFQRSADLAIMLILGGTGRLYGAIIGTFIFMIARDQLADMNPQYWYFWIGLLLMAVVLFLPGGILGGLVRLVPARWRKP
jgi:branched-chain amino acid transport system permease protein